MPTPNLRSLIGTSRAKIGTFLFEFVTPGIGQILTAAGADYVVLDMEHTGFSFETVRQVVRYCQAAELPLIVRVPSQLRHHISRALDTGADGIMVPIVSSLLAAPSPWADCSWTCSGWRSWAACGAERRSGRSVDGRVEHVHGCIKGLLHATHGRFGEARSGV